MKIHHPGDYARKRREAHKEIADQLDLLYKTLKAAGIQGDFVTYVDEIKAKYPKPGS